MHEAVFGQLWSDAMYFFKFPHIICWLLVRRNAQKGVYLHAAAQMMATGRKPTLNSALHTLKAPLSGGASVRRNTEYSSYYS